MMEGDDENASNDSGLHLPPDDMWEAWVPEQVIHVNPPDNPTLLQQPPAENYDSWDPGAASVGAHCQGGFACGAQEPGIHVETCNFSTPMSSQSNPMRYICEGNQSSEDEEDMDLPDAEQGSSFFAQQISEDEYKHQTRQYTRDALNALLQSPEYLRFSTRCQICWSVWAENQCTEHCEECGGHTMTRPCPICLGKCSRIWRRDVEMSHSNHLAHWDGECGLPPDERQGFMVRALMDNPSPDSTERAMVEALEDLATS